MSEKLRLLAVTHLVLFALYHSAGGATVGLSSAKNYPVATSPFNTVSGAVIGDFNGDGNPDLAVANSGYAALSDDGNVCILLGNGDGTFQAAKNFSAGKNPSFIAVGDFDGDHHSDVLVLNPSDSTTGISGGVSLLLANADGTLKQPVNILTGYNPSSLVIGDFDGDQKLDVAIGASDATGNVLIVLLGNGNGTFRPQTTYSTEGSPVLAGDINGDGKTDLIGTASVFCGSENFCGNIVILLGNGDGTFQPPVDGPATGQVYSIVAGDFNGDNRLDLAVSSRPNVYAIVTTAVLLNNGGETFSFSFGASFILGAVADFDGDGKLDLMTGADFRGAIGILLGSGTGSFQPSLNFVGPGSLLSVGDLNQDGLPDVVVRSRGDSVGVMLNTSRLSGADLSVDVINTTSALGDPPDPQLTVLVNNRGPHDATAVTLSNTLVGDFTSASISSSLGTCQGVAELTCDFGTLPAGTLAIITIQTQTPPMPVTVTDTAIVSGGGGDPDLSNNSSTASLTYELFTLNVAKSGNGSGTVTDPPYLGDINCGGSCSASFINGFVVPLTASPASGSTFTGWGGACTGTGFCVVTMSGNENVTATFQLAPDFSISASAPTATGVKPGGSVTSMVTVGAINGFNSSVSLTCSVSPLPDLAPQCSIDPNSVNPGIPATLKATTTAPSLAARPLGNRSFLFAACLSAFGLTLFGAGAIPSRTRKSKLIGLMFCYCILTSSALVSGCGGDNNSGSRGSTGTPPGTYTITVKGTSGSVVHSATITLTVQ